jgi:hypothetical protein
MNDYNTFYVYRVSAFDFLMFLCLEAEIAGQSIPEGSLDNWVQQAIASEISKSPLSDFFREFPEWVNDSLGSDFVQNVLMPTISRYLARKDEIDRAMCSWLKDDRSGRRNSVTLMAVTLCGDGDGHAFLSYFPIPKKFNAPPNCQLQSIQSPIDLN